MDDMGGMYPEERRAALYPEELALLERRAPGRAPPGYERGAALGNGDMFSRRSPMYVHTAALPDLQFCFGWGVEPEG